MVYGKTFFAKRVLGFLKDKKKVVADADRHHVVFTRGAYILCAIFGCGAVYLYSVLKNGTQVTAAIKRGSYD